MGKDWQGSVVPHMEFCWGSVKRPMSVGIWINEQTFLSVSRVQTKILHLPDKLSRLREELCSGILWSPTGIYLMLS